MLAEKYHFHADHALIHNETGEIADLSCHLNQWKQGEFTIANTWLLEYTSQKTITTYDVAGERGTAD